MSSEWMWLAGALLVALAVVVRVALRDPRERQGARGGESKIERIKRYRREHGVGLKEAKDAIEAEDRSEPVARPELPERALETVEALVREGNMIEAIKLYRQLHGVGLKEAKDAVERLRE